MKILFITDNFPPEINAPASRTYEHAKRWVENGNQVTIITCVPNFPKGEPFPGYKNKLWQWETMEGINVLRVWSYMSKNEGFLKRILDYVSFMISSTLASFFLKKPDLIVATSPQFFSACSGYLISVFKRRPWVFEVRDIWPESIKVVGAMKHSFALDLLEKIELFLYKKASGIAVVTHSFKTDLVKRGVPAEKISVFTNGVDSKKFPPRQKNLHLSTQLDLSNKIVFGYIGTHGMAQGLESLLHGISIVENRISHNNLKFLFVGDGAEKTKLLELSKNLNLKTVLFIDSVPKEQVADYWSLLDMAIIHLKPNPSFDSVIPSKIFESMSMGIPLAHGVKGESAQIVISSGAGLAFNGGEPESFADLVFTFINAPADVIKYMSKNGISTALNYDRNTIADSFEAWLYSLQYFRK